MIKNEFYVLNNGVKIPKIGFGTWQNNNDAECIKSVYWALINGYRHIDTAMAYSNEWLIKEGIKLSNVKREELFITSKLPAEKKGYDICDEEFNKTLKNLDTDYLDLYLIHAPNPWGMDQNSLEYMDLNIASYKRMEELYKKGKIKAIGVSNFNVEQLKILMANTEIKPMVNQIYLRVGEPRDDIRKFCEENNILVEAYCPLGTGSLIKNEKLKAVSDKYNVSVAKLCIKWCLDLGTLPLPKSVHEEYIKENLEVDFEISKEDFDYLTYINI